MIVMLPRLDYYGNKAVAEALKGKALNFFNFVANQPFTEKLMIQTKRLDDGTVLVATVNRNPADYVTGKVAVYAPVTGGKPVLKCSFLYYPRNSGGGYYSSSHGYGYPQVNRLVHTAGGGVKIIEDVHLTAQNPQRAWIGATTLVDFDLRYGLPFVSDGAAYSFENGSHYFSVIPVYGSPGYISIKVYDFSKTLKQTFTIPYLYTLKQAAANQSATEFCLLGNIQDYTYDTTKALPFSFNPADYSDGIEYQKQLKTKWEGIIRYTLVATGNPASPYTFTLLSYVEQWRGCQIHHTEMPGTDTKTDNGDGTSTFSWDISYSRSYVYSNPVVLNVHYAGDVYTEISFVPGVLTYSVSVSDSGIKANSPPGFYQATTHTRIESWDCGFYFKIDGKQGWQLLKKSISATYSKPASSYTITSSVSGSQSIAGEWPQLNTYADYAKVKPYCDVICAETDDLTYSGSGAAETLPASFTTKFQRTVRGGMTVPKGDSSAVVSDDLCSNLSYAMDSSPGKYNGVYFASSAPSSTVNNGVGYYPNKMIYIDPEMVLRKNFAKVFVDKDGSHLVVYRNTADYPWGGNYAATKAYIVNKDGNNKVDLAKVIPYPFYQMDFLGAVYTL